MDTVILYSYYETSQSIFNADFYSKFGIEKSSKIFYVIIINGNQCRIQFPNFKNLVILIRDNIGFDLGAYSGALNWLKNMNMVFKYYIFMNSTVIGPFLPTYYPKTLHQFAKQIGVSIPHGAESIHWSQIFTSKINEKVKLVGTTIACLSSIDAGGYGPKISGYCFATDEIGLNLLINNGTIFKNHETKFDLIMAKYKITKVIMNASFNIDCLLYKYENIDWKDEQNWKIYENTFPDRLDSNEGISVHPFEVVFHKWNWQHHQNKPVFFDYCKKYSEWKNENLNREIQKSINDIGKYAVNSINFLIVVATFHRDNGKSKNYLERCIKSILNQTHTNWTLVIVSDKYEPEEELTETISKFNDIRIILIKNYIVERDHIKDKRKLWTVAGATSVNIGLKFGREGNYQYYCHLDDDDYWKNNHLAILCGVYAKFSNCVFSNTQSNYGNYFLPQYKVDIYENNYLPTPQGMIHSSFSFRCDVIPFNYKTSFLESDEFEPADLVMLRNIRNFISESNDKYCSIYVSEHTCYHDTEGEEFKK